MKTLCPNYDREDALDTVLEVPVPEEMFHKMGSTAALRWANMRSLMKAQLQAADKSSHLQAKSNNEFMALLKLVGSPLIPFQVQLVNSPSRPIKDSNIEASTAKYIVQQYVAATGGQAAFNSVNSMYAMGQVKMLGSEMQQGDDSVQMRGNCEIGGFVLWQKNPDLWCLELVVSGYKICAGSDGKIAWNQSSSQPDAVCIGEKSINDEDCFVLKVEAALHVLQSQSSPNTDIIHHTVWGYFSQRTGLLMKLEDTKLVRMKPIKGKESVFWETSMATMIDDYRYVDSINIAHTGKTVTTLFRYGAAHNHKRKIEETWKIEEVDFNICGLSIEMFLPPADLKRDQEAGEQPVS
ncbi:hypothetical protein EZV62_021421 [Acer yangbiense]|uniref:DUF620 domain-containing protein n=1 Tax=Acer yangbiense TaxID=1000413 RepID=A0A5C7H738_9ROSI|nr:hypothetical protein EZV62_021421 [Acer yangbiense]